MGRSLELKAKAWAGKPDIAAAEVEVGIAFFAGMGQAEGR